MRNLLLTVFVLGTTVGSLAWGVRALSAWAERHNPVHTYVGKVVRAAPALQIP